VVRLTRADLVIERRDEAAPAAAAAAAAGTTAVPRATSRVLRLFVNALSKNDTERKGHMRYAAERPADAAFCIVRYAEAYLTAYHKGSAPTALLFTQLHAPHLPLASGTANARLQATLREVAPELDDTAFGYHSLRAGAATEAHAAGVPERLIKEQGNWKSDAVQAYIRPDVGERVKFAEWIGS
jgi:hypothetical protein